MTAATREQRLDLVDRPDHESTKDPSEKDHDSPRNSSPDLPVGEKNENILPDGRRELKETDCEELLAYNWPTWKKCMYLASIAGIQISMNFNTSVFPNAVTPLATAFNISEQEARTGQMIYLVLYSFGCELWAPWSEEFGRWPILQLSLLLINIWQIPCMTATHWGAIVVCRGLVSCLLTLLVIYMLTFSGWSQHSRWLCHTWFDCGSLLSREPTIPACLYRAFFLYRYQHWWCDWRSNSTL